jgi:hypothetical protein
LRALEFAAATKKLKPAVVGAVINPGLCLDLATSAGIAEVRKAHQSLIAHYDRVGSPPPRNTSGADRLARRLDCAVIQMLHDIREDDVESPRPIDTVFGMFLEGQPIYHNSGFRDKTHIQICVCNPACIVGIFRVSEQDHSKPSL